MAQSFNQDRVVGSVEAVFESFPFGSLTRQSWAVAGTPSFSTLPLAAFLRQAWLSLFCTFTSFAPRLLSSLMHFCWAALAGGRREARSRGCSPRSGGFRGISDGAVQSGGRARSVRFRRRRS